MNAPEQKRVVFGKPTDRTNAYPCIHPDGTPAVIYEKTTKVAQRIARAHGLRLLPTSASASLIKRHQSYDTASNPLDPGDNTTGQKIINSFALDLEIMRSGTCDLNNGMPLAHVCEMIATGLKRCESIGNSDALVVDLMVAKLATESIYRRRNRFHKWELLEKEYEDLVNASDVVAVIILSSTPEQMRSACANCDDYWNRAKDLQ